MKQSEIKVGDTLYTNIGADLCPVVVTRIVERDPTSRWSSDRKTTYEVTRVGESKPLPKRRNAAAFRRENQKRF